MLRTGIGILSNVKIIIQKKENRISFSHWTDEKSGNPEKAGRMASLILVPLIERVEQWGEEDRGTRPDFGYPLQNGPWEQWL